jgi:GT2 family glycosyltransferase
MIHVIIPTFNRLNYTIICLNSLKRQVNFKELNIIVVDDASTDGTKEYVKKNFPKITILSGTGSLFWGGAVHYGVDYALKIGKPKDWVLLVNNDAELSPDAISNLIKISKKRKRKALVGSLSINAKDKETVIKSGTIVESWFLNKTRHIFEGKKLSQILIKNPLKVDFLTGRCLLHPIEIFKKVKNYDSIRFNHYGADDEFSMRVKKYGYSTLLCPSSIIFLRNNEFDLHKKEKIKSFYDHFFSINSSSNIINKFNLTLKVVPFYAKTTFFLIGVLKSMYTYFFKN